MKKALIIVDVQNDFCNRGALAVSGADSIISGINEAAKEFEIVVTTQDWHPLNHGSFAVNNPGMNPFEMGKLSGRDQIMWPVHCVIGSPGADFHPDLDVNAVNFRKGSDVAADSYSGFKDDDGKSTGLGEFLREKNVCEVFVCGLALDFCVKFTALDAKLQGFNTSVLLNLTASVYPDNTPEVIKNLESNGITVV
ncbi:bifunctional nicotinamidase/pyrazinamidase [Myxococcota bacterium]|nr:bifunctional nicotinamidase/pyrazinamidase [Myxococcota bacterium]MBU1380929.1 bifunctional nicotinamidase/pyrazinamidase [Myxococcota bacterium]MBU1498481.1 bifunctional nicotinamidase/pyrazinamidase [Myxococcota bacterium]